MSSGVFKKFRFFVLGCMIQLLGFSLETQAADQDKSMELSSPALKNNAFIPPLYTAKRQDISIPLAEKNALRLTRNDSDTSRKTWIDWALYNVLLNISPARPPFSPSRGRK